MLLGCVAGRGGGFSNRVVFKGAELILKKGCGYVVPDRYKQLCFFFGDHVHGCVRNASFECLHWCRLSVVLRKY
jgi:hypothetical protein